MGKLPPHEDLVRTGHVLRGVGDLGGRYAQLVGCTQRPVWITQCGAANLMFISSLMYRGPQQITVLKRGLAQLLRRDGFEHVSDAVGVDVE